MQSQLSAAFSPEEQTSHLWATRVHMQAKKYEIAIRSLLWIFPLFQVSIVYQVHPLSCMLPLNYKTTAVVILVTSQTDRYE